MTARRAWVLGPVVAVGLAVAFVSGAGAADPLPGSAGVDTSLPATDSQVTVKGRGPFADLEVTVNQTKNLTNQAVSITWTGARPTETGVSRYDGNYLQIMQCWGDDDGTVPANPGPPPEQCVWGAITGIVGGGLPNAFIPEASNTLSRIVSTQGWANASDYDKAPFVRGSQDFVWRAFRAVDGTVVGPQIDVDYNPSLGGGNFWLNPFFNIITTNEIGIGVTAANGKGTELVQVNNGTESTGLGCGQKVQRTAGSERKIPKCWIVVVPRGTGEEENVGTGITSDQPGVMTSPLSTEAWQHRIAIPVEFIPVDTPCSLNDNERRISGNSLALPAVASWQPALCTRGTVPYSFAPVSDATARQQLANPSAGSPGLVIVSRPLDTETLNASNPVVYAPLSASGLTIGFNIERIPQFTAPPAAQGLAGVRVAQINLTPRLVAKLLTQSYQRAVEIVQRPSYSWLTRNAAHLGTDPDFLQFNPEFVQLDFFNTRTMSGLSVPAGNADAATQVWEWILADPEARAWLDGQPDPWGMRVNPVYSTNPSVNPNGASFADPVPNTFPKSDPYCYQAPTNGSGITPPPLCGTDWLPYVGSFAEAAQVTRAAADRARVGQNTTARTVSDAWRRETPQTLGRRSILSITDTPSAARYGLQVARLSRAGDNGANRAFLAPDATGLTAGLASMAARQEATVLEPTTATAPGAYPLTALTYGAIAPLALDASARADYATFVEYASEVGQVQGLELGQLPPGYVPLSPSLKAQAAAAAAKIRTLQPEPTDPATTASTSTTTPATATTTTSAAPTTTVAAAAAGDRAPAARIASGTTARVTRSTSTRQTARVTLDPPTDQLRTTAPPAETALPEPSPPPSETPTASELPAPTPVEITADQPAPPAVTVATPILALSRSRLAIPGLGVMAIVAALGALEITKRPRRAGAAQTVQLSNEEL